MIKRFFSKRSGFTLVEILVAFAIFTIMMSMIMQILQLSVAARRQNNEMSRDRSAQEEQIILGKDMNYDTSEPETGTLGLKFAEDQSYELKYQIKGTDADNPADGLNYFVANVDYNAKVADGDKIDKKKKSGSQMSFYDTRITGTAGIGDITLSVEDNGGGRYLFTLKADSEDVGDEMKKYTQIRLYFFNDSKTYSDVYEYVEGYVEKEDGPEPSDIKRYKKCSIPAYASEVGLIGGNQITSKISKDESNKGILLQGLGNSVRISYYSGSTFTGTEIKFYVQFEEDPKLKADSFGDNGVANGSSVTYSKYTHIEDKVETEERNIYGAKPYDIDEDDFGGIWVAGKDDWDKNPGKNVRDYATPEDDPDKGDEETPDPSVPGEGGDTPDTPTPDPTPDTPEGGESTPDTPVEGGGE